MVFDENFFVLVPTLLFVALTYRPIKKHLSQFLDNRSSKIKGQLDEAAQLKADAIKLLHEQKMREKAIHEEALQLINHAREEVERLQNETKAQLEDTLRRREQMAFTRIATVEREAMNSVKQFAVQLTFETVSRLLKEKLPAGVAQRLMDDSIQEMPSKMKLN
jgi:F-type H+-transporting ATPase subunit b